MLVSHNKSDSWRSLFLNFCCSAKTENNRHHIHLSSVVLHWSGNLLMMIDCLFQLGMMTGQILPALCRDRLQCDRWCRHCSGVSTAAGIATSRQRWVTDQWNTVVLCRSELPHLCSDCTHHMRCSQESLLNMNEFPCTTYYQVKCDYSLLLWINYTFICIN